jgi:predicted Fe-Mo cluster-binding NifX family protein
MKVLISTDKNRIAPLLDASARFELVSPRRNGERMRRTLHINEMSPCPKIRHIVSTGATLLICGAVSKTLEAMLSAAGIRVIPNTCGQLDDVINAVISGTLTEQSYLMPGCNDRQRGRWSEEECKSIRDSIL